MKRKLKIFQIVLMLSFLLFLFFLIKPKDYQKEYTIKKVDVKEIYNKKEKYYYFTFNYQNKIMDYLIKSKYKQHRGFIEDIELIENNDDFCIIPKSDTFDFVPLCIENGENIYFDLVSDNLKSKIPSKYFYENKIKETSYDDVKIYNKDYNYLLWNYTGFYYLNNDVSKKINIFNKEIYNASLIGYTEDFLVVADYDNNYTFQKFYTIAFKNGDVQEYEIKPNIYFDSYFIGYEKNKIYLVDNKEALMYEFNAKNGKIEKVKSKVLVDGKWENKNIKSLINKKDTFSYKTLYQYILDDKNLYLNYKDRNIKTLVTKDITSIVRIKDDEIFYLKKDTLYSFNPLIGEKKLLSYFEWNFKFENMIYID